MSERETLAPPWRVRALEWEDDGGPDDEPGTVWAARDPYGVAYRIEREREDGDWWRAGQWTISHASLYVCTDPFDTLEEAQAAAQADHEARIRACLEPAPCPICDGSGSVSTTKTDSDGDNIERACPRCGSRHQHLHLHPAHNPMAEAALTQAARDVLAERERQMAVEGWTPEHDDMHTGGEMAQAAAAYALASAYPVPTGRTPVIWPWDSSWWRPTTRRRDLVKAGALILAEIERLDRAALARMEAPDDQA